jgi:hypothetical protein
VPEPLVKTVTVCAIEVNPVPPLATGNVPVTPVDKGKPVALVNVPLCGVPRIGVTKVGLVANTLLPVPVLVTLTKPLEASVATALEAVRLVKIGCALNDAIPPTYRFLAIPTPPAVMIEPVETLEESVVKLDVNPWAKVIRAVVVVCPSLVMAVVSPVAKSLVKELNAEDDMTVPATTG